MGFFRILLLAFNVAVITFLIYRLLQIYESAYARKGWILLAGILLLLVPIAIIVGILRPTPAYLLIYPVAISLFLYLIKSVDRY